MTNSKIASRIDLECAPYELLVVPAATSIVRRINTEIVMLTAFFEERIRKRAVPVDAARVRGTVVIALVEEPLTMVDIVPEQSPVDSVHVPEQRCIVTVSPGVEKVC